MPYADLERFPEVIAVAGGEAETEALRAVQRGRAVSLVADSDVATKLLGQDPPTCRRR
jgi:DNA-binding transcriptional regulator LsrR (DeoR family)